MPVIQFAVQSYKGDSLPISAQQAVNVYAEKQPPDAKTEVALFGCPGIADFSTCGSGPIRALHTMHGVAYALSGGTLYSIPEDGGAGTPVGSSVSGSGRVSTADNGLQLQIVNAANGYIYSQAGGFQLITDAQFQAANTTTFINQYFVLDALDTGTFYKSEPNDGTSYIGTETGSAEAYPDDVVAVDRLGEILVAFGDKSIEGFQDVGAANFPFARIPGGVIERGIAAPLAKVRSDNALFFLGDDRVFYRLSGINAPTRVSTHALEQIWRRYTTVTDAHCVAYDWNGHKFIALTFPTENATAELDLATGLWHERESWDENGNSLGRWRVNCICEAYGKILVGDAYSGKVGYLDGDTYTEFGSIMRGLATGSPLHSDRKRVFMSKFELDIESGVGLTTGQGSDPQIMYDYSDDGGRTWSQRQQWQSMGAKGAYRQRLRWKRQGSFRQRIPRIHISDPVKRVIIAAHAEMSAG